MKVLVTGVSGFIGGYLAERLVEEGHEVAGLVRQTNRLGFETYQRLLGKVQMYHGSLADPIVVDKMVADFRPEVICSLAAISPVAYSFDHPDEVTRVNYLGQIYLSEAALKHCENLKRYIFSSSMETYGSNTKRTAFIETDEQKPACPYAVAKVASEKYLQYLNYAHKFPCVSLRQTNAFGRKENSYFITEAAISQFLKSSVANFGDPRPVRNFIFIDDLVQLYVDLIAAKDEKVNGEVFNVGPDNALSIGDLILKIRDKVGFGGQINWHTRPKRPGEIFYLNSSNAKVTEAIGWSPKVSLDEGLDRTIEIWKKNLGA